MEIVMQILRSVSSLSLPFGLTYGGLIIFLWSIPLLPRLFKSVF